jgi:hypothetical protein
MYFTLKRTYRYNIYKHVYKELIRNIIQTVLRSIEVYCKDTKADNHVIRPFFLEVVPTISE